MRSIAIAVGADIASVVAVGDVGGSLCRSEEAACC